MDTIEQKKKEKTYYKMEDICTENYESEISEPWRPERLRDVYGKNDYPPG